MKLFKLINLVSPDLYQLFHMLVGEVQAQHGMKITDWKNPERSLVLSNLLQYSCLENPMDRGAW